MAVPDLGGGHLATAGLGYRIFLVRRYMAMDVIIPYVIWITLLAWLMDLALRQLHKPVSRGRKEESMSFIDINNIWQEYGDHVVLERINLQVKEGEFCSMVGASGCGKSTFLRLLLGQEKPPGHHHARR
jgi:ABC-type bacteriocin/lantibiotic exporter with double-glycine peptidase domain